MTHRWSSCSCNCLRGRCTILWTQHKASSSTQSSLHVQMGMSRSWRCQRIPSHAYYAQRQQYLYRSMHLLGKGLGTLRYDKCATSLNSTPSGIPTCTHNKAIHTGASLQIPDSHWFAPLLNVGNSTRLSFCCDQAGSIHLQPI